MRYLSPVVCSCVSNFPVVSPHAFFQQKKSNFLQEFRVFGREGFFGGNKRMVCGGDIFTRYVSLLFCTCIQPISSCVDAGKRRCGLAAEEIWGRLRMGFQFFGRGKAARHWYNSREVYVCTVSCFPFS